MIASLVLIVVGSYLSYRLGCWVHDRAERQTTEHEIRRRSDV